MAIPWKTSRCILLSSLCAALASGCREGDPASSEEAGTGGTGGAAPSCEAVPLASDPELEAQLTFIVDIAPIWKTYCAGFGCHDDPYEADSHEAFLQEWVGQVSPVADEMLRIAPGDPAQSFVMHKVDGTQLCAGIACSFQGCGLAMPPGEQPLTEDRRSLFRVWIAQGAELGAL